MLQAPAAAEPLCSDHQSWHLYHYSLEVASWYPEASFLSLFHVQAVQILNFCELRSHIRRMYDWQAFAPILKRRDLKMLGRAYHLLFRRCCRHEGDLAEALRFSGHNWPRRGLVGMMALRCSGSQFQFFSPTRAFINSGKILISFLKLKNLSSPTKF